MDRDLESFFGMAREVALSPAERGQLFAAFLPLLSLGIAGAVRNAEPARHTMQMSKSDQHFAGQARHAVRLSPGEKSAVFRSIQKFMKDYPYVGSESRQTSWSIVDLFAQVRLMPMMASVLILVLGLGGTASYAAQSALPGDTLYPMKIYVNESMRSTFAFSPEAKARVESARAQKRLEEAEVLALETRLSPEHAAFLTSQMEKHSANVRRQIERLQESGQVEIASEIDEHLNTSLLAHDFVLQKVAHSRQGARREIAVLLKGVRTVADMRETDGGIAIAAVAMDAANGEASATVALKQETVADEGASSSIIARAIVTDHKAEAKIDEAHSRIAAVRSSIESRKNGASVSLQSEAKIVEAESALAEARIKLRTGSSGEADTLRKQSLRNIEEAQLFMNIEQKLGAEGNKKERSQGAASAQLKHAQKKIDDAWALFARVGSSADAEAKLNDAKAKLAEARIKLDASLFGESQDLSKAASKLIAEARSILTAAERSVRQSDIQHRIDEAKKKAQEKKEEVLREADRKIQDIVP